MGIELQVCYISFILMFEIAVEGCMLVLCGHTAVFMSAGVSLAVDCGGWVSAVCVRLVYWGPCDVMLGIVPAWDRVFWEGGCLGEGG